MSLGFLLLLLLLINTSAGLWCVMFLVRNCIRSEYPDDMTKTGDDELLEPSNPTYQQRENFNSEESPVIVSSVLVRFPDAGRKSEGGFSAADASSEI